MVSFYASIFVFKEPANWGHCDYSMFIPVDDDSSGWNQSVWRIEKDKEGNITRKRLFGVRYVPLTDAPKR